MSVSDVRPPPGARGWAPGRWQVRLGETAAFIRAGTRFCAGLHGAGRVARVRRLVLFLHCARNVRVLDTGICCRVREEKEVSGRDVGAGSRGAPADLIATRR